MSSTDRPDYLDNLGLEEAPFQLWADPRFFYADPELMQRLDLLQHLTQFGDMLLCVTGPAGSGKTSLLRQFAQRGKINWHIGLLDANDLSQPSALWTRLAATLELPGNSGDLPALRTDLLRHYQALLHNAKLPVVLIDNAERLPMPVLKALLELDGRPAQTLKLLRIILFTEPGLEQRLTDAGLHSAQQPLLHSIEIPHFDEQQTAAYLMYRLAVAGYSGESPFSFTQIRALHKAADGLPARLNELAHETLLEHAARLNERNRAAAGGERMPVSPGHRPAILAAIAGIGAVLIGATYWIQSTNEPRAPEPETTLSSAEPLPLPPARKPLPQPPIKPDTQSKSDQPKLDTHLTAPINPIINPDTQVNSPAEPVPAPSQPQERFKETPKLHSQANNLDSQPNAGVPPRPATAPPTPGLDTSGLQAPAPQPPKQDTQVNSDTPLTDGVALDARPTPAAEPESAQPPSTQPHEEPKEKPKQAKQDSQAESQAESETRLDEPKLTNRSSGNSQAKAVTSPTEQAASSPAPATVQIQNAPYREDWVRQRPSTHFSLQLLGVRDERSLLAFLKRTALPVPVAYYQTEYKGGPWWVLLQGDYPTRAAARQGIEALPASLRKAQPWPRSFSEIQAELNPPSP